MIIGSSGVDFSPDQISEEMSKRGKAWAELDGAYRALDDATKSVLSNIASRMDGSEAAKDREARGHKEYREHLEYLATARTAALVAKVNYDVWKMWIDMKRSEISYTKAQMNIL